ncbi:DUF309 domain-containing protein [Bacillus sp. HMF5848]|uniref:DUF309 domain-containing protein n=1 Tax=Bacillus sp. HMF5848 TaxID=2495421 RepID=UPI000F783E80|nr:DUF309 domain-containing protein [Bacillus sp. HMF5848]RSK28420.1 DUF309 domain-containing protein [Bacillus sp. HMF5848]
MESYPLEYYQFFVLFNEGDYYTSHDLLEDIWLTDRSNLFIKGLLQMTVALYHYSYGNIKGTRSMLETAYDYLEEYEPFHWGVDVIHVRLFIKECLSIIPHDLNNVSHKEINNLPVLPELILYMKDDL